MTRPAPMADGTLAALAKRVEAEPASRALDVEIMLALGFTTIPFGHDDGCWMRQIGDEWIEIGSHANSGSSTADRYVARYTSSIDAANMLRPVDCEWHAAVDGNTRCNGVLFKSGVHDIIVDITGPHAESRARLAAALRARDAGGT